MGYGNVYNGGLHMSNMYISQKVGSRNYSLHWRDGHGTWAGNHSGGIPAHPTVLGYMIGNRKQPLLL